MAILKQEEGEEGHPRSIAQIRRDRDSERSNNNITTLSENVAEDDGLILRDEQDAHATSLESLCSSKDGSAEINIICGWEAHGNESDKIIGQHHLRQLEVRPQYQSKGCPLIVSAKYKDLFRHDFAISPLVSAL